MLKPKRRYSEDDKATTLAVLQSCNGNVTRTARETGIPAATISKWRDGKHINESVTEMCDIKKGELKDRFEVIAHSLVDAIPGAIAGANLQQITTSLAIAIDKMLLLKGQPTDISHVTNTSNLTNEQRAERITELLNLGRARMKLVEGHS